MSEYRGDALREAGDAGGAAACYRLAMDAYEKGVLVWREDKASPVAHVRVQAKLSPTILYQHVRSAAVMAQSVAPPPPAAITVPLPVPTLMSTPAAAVMPGVSQLVGDGIAGDGGAPSTLDAEPDDLDYADPAAKRIRKN